MLEYLLVSASNQLATSFDRCASMIIDLIHVAGDHRAGPGAAACVWTSGQQGKLLLALE